MTENEKIFDAFRNCITEPKCRDCPWDECNTLNNGCVEIPRDLALAVMRMLAEQEPRVMTLESSDADWRNGVLWLEQRDYKSIRPCLFRNCREQLLFGRLERVMCFDVVGRLDSVYMLRNYGVKWRCWTSRPTDAQREATSWE